MQKQKKIHIQQKCKNNENKKNIASCTTQVTWKVKFKCRDNQDNHDIHADHDDHLDHDEHDDYDDHLDHDDIDYDDQNGHLDQDDHLNRDVHLDHDDHFDHDDHDEIVFVRKCKEEKSRKNTHTTKMQK